MSSSIEICKTINNSSKLKTTKLKEQRMKFKIFTSIERLKTAGDENGQALDRSTMTSKSTINEKQ